VEHAENRRIAKSLITPDETEISDAVLSLGQIPELSAIVTNDSRYELAELALKVIVIDCNDQTPKPPKSFVLDKKIQDAERCSVVGQDMAHVYSIDVPSG
jgi:hypothetical protein